MGPTAAAPALPRRRRWRRPIHGSPVAIPPHLPRAVLAEDLGEDVQEEQHGVALLAPAPGVPEVGLARPLRIPEALEGQVQDGHDALGLKPLRLGLEPSQDPVRQFRWDAVPPRLEAVVDVVHQLLPGAVRLRLGLPRGGGRRLLRPPNFSTNPGGQSRGGGNPLLPWNCNCRCNCLLWPRHRVAMGWLWGGYFFPRTPSLLCPFPTSLLQLLPLPDEPVVFGAEPAVVIPPPLQGPRGKDLRAQSSPLIDADAGPPGQDRVGVGEAGRRALTPCLAEQEDVRAHRLGGHALHGPAGHEVVRVEREVRGLILSRHFRSWWRRFPSPRSCSPGSPGPPAFARAH